MTFSHMGLPALLGAFAAAAVVVWIAGIRLSQTVNVMDDRFHLGQALGGVILLAITTNLPEIAITFNAARHHALGIAIGNILGGIAVQTVVLVLLDIWGLGNKDALTYRAASLQLVLEGVLVGAVLVVVVMGSQLPATVYFARMTPASIAITAIWIGGVWLLGKARTCLPWQEQGQAPDNQQTQSGSAEQQKHEAKKSIGVTVAVFSVAALATLAAGMVLEQTGEQIAAHIHMTGVLFGATVLAAATSLPELSTGLASVKSGDYQLAFSDILGGNAFLPVLFLMADIVGGQAVLPQAQKSDLYLTGLGVLLTAIYIYGLIFRPKRQIARMGLDSLTVLLVYGLGMVGLVALARGH